MPAALGAKPNRKLPAQDVIHTVTHPVRWAILNALKGSMTAGEVAEKVKLRPANVQYHLKVLAGVGLVDELPRPENERVFVYNRATLKGHLGISPNALWSQVDYD